MLRIKRLVFNMFDENTYLLVDTATNDAAVVDPGMFNVNERAEFDKCVSDNNLKLTLIINTHMHLDHCFGDNYVAERYGISIAANAADAPLGLDIGAQIRGFGGRGHWPAVNIDKPLADGDIITIGESKLQVIATPGHSPGGICLYSEADGILLSGDTLFEGGVGRTDLMGGDANQLITGIRERLFALPDDTIVLPGHGDATTIGQEKATNPYV